MYHKSQAIVLHTINYNDKYILVVLYTNTLGRVTYMISKSKSKSKKIAKSFFSPLTILEVEADHIPTRDIQRIKEASILYPLHSIQRNMVKTSIIFFLSEFLSRILKDTDQHELIFEYIKDSVLLLEESNIGLANFHLVFILKLTRFLGFYPNLEEYSEGDYFDLINGVFVKSQPLHNHYVNVMYSRVLLLLGRINYKNMHHFKFSRKERIFIVERMLEYYRIHLHDFQQLKSLDVLHELF